MGQLGDRQNQSHVNWESAGPALDPPGHERRANERRGTPGLLSGGPQADATRPAQSPG